jgi:hypothetical protein
MMKIVTPLGVNAVTASLACADYSRIVQVTPRDEHQVTPEHCFEYVDFSGQLFEKMTRRRIDKRVDRIDAQASDMVVT